MECGCCFVSLRTFQTIKSSRKVSLVLEEKSGTVLAFEIGDIHPLRNRHFLLDKRGIHFLWMHNEISVY